MSERLSGHLGSDIKSRLLRSGTIGPTETFESLLRSMTSGGAQLCLYRGTSSCRRTGLWLANRGVNPNPIRGLQLPGFYYAAPAPAVPASWGWTAPQYGTDSAVNFTGLVQARGIVW